MKAYPRDFANQATTKLDAALLDQQGRLKLFPAEHYHAHFTQDEINCWAVQRARYCLPTTELVTWLQQQIASRPALEIGAGMGDLCHHLGIRGTDAYLQNQGDDITRYYQAVGQQPTQPPRWVEKRTANAAVKRYRPQVVIGAYITHLWQPGDTYGSDYGVNETEILRQVQTYIHIGNHNVHQHKHILALPHTEIQPTWLITRATYPDQNIIYIWNHN